MFVHCTNTFPRHQPLEAAPHWHMGKHVTKRHRRSSWSMQKAVGQCRKQLVNAESSYMQARRQNNITLINWNRLSLRPTHTAQPALFRATRKHVSISVTRKVKYAYHIWKYADAVDQQSSKLVHACRATASHVFFETQCIIHIAYYVIVVYIANITDCCTINWVN